MLSLAGAGSRVRLPLIPKARGLTLGYMLSPAGAGSRRCLARGLASLARTKPRARGLALGYMLPPAGAGSRAPLHPELRTSVLAALQRVVQDELCDLPTQPCA